jgi:2'-5' RNA ligase
VTPEGLGVRTFVAIKPPGSVLDAIAARTAGLEIPDARLTPRAQWHITLQFLGDTADVDAVIALLDALDTAPAIVQLSHAEPLGNPRRAKVFAVMVAEGGAWMRSLAEEIARRLEPTGFVPEDRPFLPHLTLARCRRTTPMTAARAAVGEDPIGDPWFVDHVVVYESRLGSGPAEHLVRATVPLGP